MGKRRRPIKESANDGRVLNGKSGANSGVSRFEILTDLENQENDLPGIIKESNQPFKTTTSYGEDASNHNSGNRVMRKKTTTKSNRLEGDLNMGLGLSSVSPIIKDPLTNGPMIRKAHKSINHVNEMSSEALVIPQVITLDKTKQSAIRIAP